MSHRPKNFRTLPRGIVVVNTDNIVAYAPTPSGKRVTLTMKSGRGYEFESTIEEFEQTMFGEPNAQPIKV